MDSMRNVIRECVEQYEGTHEGEERVYQSSIMKARQLDLEAVTRKDIEEVVKPFLYQWGKMGRALGGSKPWIENVARIVPSQAGLLGRYRGMKLGQADLPQEEENIKGLYELLSQEGLLGPVGAAKCLHLFCPGFFPLWDTAIAEAAQKERNVRVLNERSSEDFYQFAGQVQRFIGGNLALIQDLGKKYNKTEVKIVDEVLWWVTQRPLFLIL